MRIDAITKDRISEGLIVITALCIPVIFFTDYQLPALLIGGACGLTANYLIRK